MRTALPLLAAADFEASAARAVGMGNEKLGRRIGTFSLPAVHTCDRGSTPTCRALCYADSPQSRFAGPVVQKRYWANLAFTRRPEFVDTLVARLNGGHLAAFRWHVSGDVYSPAYAAAILAIAERTALPTYLYTRVWRDAAMLPLLKAMATVPHFSLWLSCDRDTGRPPPVPRVRVAYLQVAAGDAPAYPVDLVFRDRPARAAVAKRVAGALVCPVENGVTAGVTCQTCRVCFTDPTVDPTRRTRGRFQKDSHVVPPRPVL